MPNLPRWRAIGAAVILLLTATAWSAWRVSAIKRQRPPAPSIASRLIVGEDLGPAAAAIVNFADLARHDTLRAERAGPQVLTGVTPPDDEYEEPEPANAGVITRGVRDAMAQSNEPSPSATLSFQGLDDIPAVGTGSSFIPPDTDGAVGPSRIFNTLNNNYRVLNKADGAVVSTVSMTTFWASTGASGLFDPRTLYDPYQNRFIVSAVSNSQSSNSSLLIGVSTSGDPAGSWLLVRYQMGNTLCDSSFSCWADYPTLGFNQKWLAVAVNMFSTSSGTFIESRVNIFNYAALRAGSAPADRMFLTDDFTVHPVVTYSSTEATLYAPVHVSSAGRSYRLNTITGTADNPAYTQGALKTHSLVGNWTQPGTCSPGPCTALTLPQAGNPIGGTNGVDSGDARIMNAIFRNNAIWYAQTVALPAGGSATHTAAQWIKVDATGSDLDAGRVEDPLATFSNGGEWYAYPSLAVNANNDVLMGFSQFSSARFPSAAYAFRGGGDAAGTMRTPITSKAGQGYYFKTFSGTRNRWGDYSCTQVDPADDLSMWTVQEYSKLQSGTTSQWSTWWVQVSPPGAVPVPAPAMAVDTPAADATVLQPFAVAGWAIDRGGTAGTGVDAVHVWAYPASGAPVFVGVATYGVARSDVGAVYGSRFTNSGYSVSVTSLPAGAYTLVVSAYSNVSASFNQSKSVVVTIAPSLPAMSLDAPANSSTVGTAFTVSGWAVDRAAATGTGVDVIHIWAFTTNGGAAMFVGQATYGLARGDVGAVFGSRFTNSGFTLAATLPAGTYQLIAYARSLVTNTFNGQAALITVSGPVSNPAMAVDTPATGSTRSQPFPISGWAVDRGASSGPGVDVVHIWAFPVSGGGSMFVAQASYGNSRADVGAVFGSQFTDSGYSSTVTGLPPGVYDLGVYARSTVTGTFNQVKLVRVTVQ